MRAVQGDSGHARGEMVADVYSHILDEDCKVNAKRFDEQFYGGKAKGSIPVPKFMSVEAIVKEEPAKAEFEETPDETSNDIDLLKKLFEKPALAALLKTLAANL